jgi:hypothetical protein
MKLNNLSVKDKPLFDKFLKLTQHELSAYAFQNIYIWREGFKIYWQVINKNLCVFFRDKIGCFLYLPPLGKNIKPEVIKEVFRIMDKFNRNKEISRIENVEERDLSFYQNLGYASSNKFCDYLCQRQDLARLKGNKFKSQRASFNYFLKHYKFQYLLFSLKYKDACLRLYQQWLGNRSAQNKDPIYQGMLGDSRDGLKILLGHYRHLDIIGRLVKIDYKVKAFTFGFPLNKDTFCILYETTDLAIKGLAQFIFRQFCRELKNYRYINIMDDSGLENLKKVKLSYHPVRLIPNYIITRKNV